MIKIVTTNHDEVTKTNFEDLKEESKPTDQQEHIKDIK